MKKRNKVTARLLVDIVTEKCPNCKQAQVFKKSNNLLEMPVMKDKCEKCNYSFDREPGYFLGAMYISYGIAVFVALLTFLLFHFAFPSLPLIYTPIAMGLSIILIARKNYKISRILYIYLFPW